MLTDVYTISSNLAALKLDLELRNLVKSLRF